MNTIIHLIMQTEHSSRYYLRPFAYPLLLTNDECNRIDMLVRKHNWQETFEHNGIPSSPPSSEILEAIIFSILSFIQMKKIFSSKFVINKVISKTDVGEKTREVDAKVRLVNSELNAIASAINHLYGLKINFDKWIYELNFWRAYAQDGINITGSVGRNNNEALNNLIIELALIYESHTDKPAPHNLAGGAKKDGAGPFLRLIETCLDFAEEQIPKKKIIQAVRWLLDPANIIKEKKSNTADSL